MGKTKSCNDADGVQSRIVIHKSKASIKKNDVVFCQSVDAREPIVLSDQFDGLAMPGWPASGVSWWWCEGTRQGHWHVK